MYLFYSYYYVNVVLLCVMCPCTDDTPKWLVPISVLTRVRREGEREGEEVLHKFLLSTTSDSFSLLHVGPHTLIKVPLSPSLCL